MTRIGLLSDTHGFLHEKVFDFFGQCHEIWHAGDIGTHEVLDRLSGFKTTRAVFGNIDGSDIRLSCPLHQLFLCEEVKVFMTHIGGYPGRYNPAALKLIREEKPQLFISGHSHILKVINDSKHKLLHINPGAAGNSGLHKHITLVKFEIDGNRITNLEIFESTRSRSPM